MSQPVEEAAHSLYNVAQSALSLAKAELKLLSLQGKSWFGKLSLALGLLAAAGVLLPIAFLLMALAPLFVGYRPWYLVALSIALPLVPGLTCALWARHELKRQLRPAPLVSQRDSLPSVTPAPNQVQGRGPTVP